MQCRKNTESIDYNIKIIYFSRVSSNNKEKQDYWNRYSNVYNEYVVYDDKQVSVRYVLKLGSSDKVDTALENRESNEGNGSSDSDSNEEDEEMDDEEVDPSDEAMV